MSVNSWDGWVHYDGCVVCPICNEFTSCEDAISDILATIEAHICHR